MSDHGLSASPEASWLGVKLTFAVAGFWGGVVSLSFIKNLTPWQGVLAVLTGIGSASYGTPFAAHYVLSASDPNEGLANAIAFVIGLTAMNLIPGLLKLTELWRKNPLMFIRGSSSADDK